MTTIDELKVMISADPSGLVEGFARAEGAVSGTAARIAGKAGMSIDQLLAKFDPATASAQRMGRELAALFAAQEAGINIAGGFAASYDTIIEKYDLGALAAQRAAAAQKELVESARAGATAENSQRAVNDLLGVTPRPQHEASAMRSDATAAFGDLIRQQDAEAAALAEKWRNVTAAVGAAAAQLRAWQEAGEQGRADLAADKARAAFDELIGVQERATLSARESAAAFQDAFAAGDQRLANIGAGVAEAARLTQAETERSAATLQRYVDIADPAAAIERRRAADIEAVTNALKVQGATTEKRASVLAAVNATYDQQAESLRRLTDSTGRYTLSSGQMQNALRQVPMQMTDIVTSLLAGQPPLMVLLQQGGQLKDAFGGAVPALKAVGGYILGLVNPMTLSAAAVAALAVAWAKGSEEASAFNKALALTGDYAGITASRAQDMARQMAAAGGTVSGAMEALTAAATTGKLTGESLKLVASAAMAMEEATGKAVGETVKEFVRLQDDPVSALMKLNEEMHFLDAATYQRIRTLAEQGREEDAAAEATKVYAQATVDAAGRVIENLGYLEKAWRGIRGAASDAWDAMQGIGREKTLAEKIADQEKIVQDLMKRISQTGSASPSFFEQAAAALGGGGIVPPGMANLTIPADADIMAEQKRLDELYRQLDLETDITATVAERTRLNKEGVEATARLDDQLAAARTNEEKRLDLRRKAEADFARAEAAGRAYSQAEREKILAGIDKKYPAVPDAAQREIEKLRENTAGYEAQAAATAKLTQAEKDRVEWRTRLSALEEKRKAGGDAVLSPDERSVYARRDEISAGYDAQAEAARKAKAREDEIAAAKKGGTTTAAVRELQALREREASLRAQLTSTEKLTQDEKALAEFNQKIADLKSKPILTAAEKSVLATEAETRAQLDQNVAVAKEVELKLQSIKAQERLKGILESIDAAQENQRRQYIEQLTGVGMGSQVQDRIRAQQGIIRDYNREIAQYQKQAVATSEGVLEIQARLAEALAAQRDYYAELDRLNGDWQNGASEAFQNYIAEAKDVAGQTERIFSSAISGVEDLFVRLSTTGKASVKDLVTAVQADLARLTFRRGAAAIYDEVLGSLSGGGSGKAAKGAGGGGLGSLISELFGGSSRDAVSSDRVGRASLTGTLTKSGLGAAPSVGLSTEAKAAAGSCGCAGEVVGEMTDQMGSVFDSATDTLGSIADDAWSSLTGIAENATSGFSSIVQGLIQFLIASSASGSSSGGGGIFSIVSSLFGSGKGDKGASGGSFDGILSDIGSFFSADSGGVGSLSKGGLASGGLATPGSFYEVNERGPELYTTSGRTYLMAGGAGGYVTPLTSGSGGAGSSLNLQQNFYLQDGRSVIENRRAIANAALSGLGRVRK